VRFDVEFDAFLHLVAGLGEKSGIAVDEANLDGLRSRQFGSARDRYARQGQHGSEDFSIPHPISLVFDDRRDSPS
jgi:hypothetical protein